MALTANDVGARVVVRRVVPGPGPRPALSDVLGELVSLDATTLVLRRSNGELVTVATADVRAAKPVPPRRERWTIAALEAIAAPGWRGLEEHRLGGWLLRAGNGFTGRANSVLPLGEPDRSRTEALDYVVGWYADRGLPPLFQLPMPLAAELDEELAGAGWRGFSPVRFLIAPLDRVLAACPERTDLPPVQHDPTPSEDWLTGYQYRGAVLPDGARTVLTNADEPTFASVSDGERLLVVGRGVVHQGWLGVTAVTVPAAGRRRGLGTHLMNGLVRWGRARGARHCYLQVAGENADALRFYDRLGFVIHHRYHYRIKD